MSTNIEAMNATFKAAGVSDIPANVSQQIQDELKAVDPRIIDTFTREITAKSGGQALPGSAADRSQAIQDVFWSSLSDSGLNSFKPADIAAKGTAVMAFGKIGGIVEDAQRNAPAQHAAAAPAVSAPPAQARPQTAAPAAPAHAATIAAAIHAATPHLAPAAHGKAGGIHVAASQPAKPAPRKGGPQDDPYFSPALKPLGDPSDDDYLAKAAAMLCEGTMALAAAQRREAVPSGPSGRGHYGSLRLADTHLARPLVHAAPADIPFHKHPVAKAAHGGHGAKPIHPSPHH